jgi:hypothetical protein
VKLAVGHLLRYHQFLVQRAQLQSAQHVRRLIDRRVRPVERAPHFTLRVGALERHLVHHVFDGLFRRHLAEVEAEREDDARAAMHAPREGAKPIFRRDMEVMIPQEHLPVQ